MSLVDDLIKVLGAMGFLWISAYCAYLWKRNAAMKEFMREQEQIAIDNIHDRYAHSSLESLVESSNADWDKRAGSK